MKQLTIPTIIICSLAVLSARSGIFTNSLDAAQLVVIDTVGIDAASSGVRLTMSHTGSGEDDENAVFTGEGATVSAAMDSITDFSYKGDIFPAHVESILIGKDTLPYLGEILSFICTSPDIIIDVPVFLIKDADALKVMSSAGESIGGIMSALISRTQVKHAAPIFTAAEISDELKAQGCALINVLSYAPSSQENEGEKGMTVGLDGFAAVNLKGEAEFIGADIAPGTAILTGGLGVSNVTVNFGSEAVTLEIRQAEAEITPKWGESGLDEIGINVTVHASILEGQLESYAAALTLQKEMARQISENISLSMKLGADIFHIEDQLISSAPGKYHRLYHSEPLFRSGRYSISVKGRIDHSYDTKDGIF